MTTEAEYKATIERLQARIYELEDFQQRVEASAADTIHMAEELAIARGEAEEALRRAQEYQEAIQRLALHDPLTGLANRNSFVRRFDESLAAARREETCVALMLLDLDHFKGINDSFGHPVGDQLLAFFANQLVKITRETDTVARLGGDEFAVILTHLNQEDRAVTVAERIIALFDEPIILQSSLVDTGVSIGISLFGRDAVDADDMMSKADKALYAAKESGRGGYMFYDPEIDRQARDVQILENELRLAIVRKEFVLHYQPQLTSTSDGIDCIEALVRWNHPTRGLLYPGDFISVSEGCGLIVPIGKLVMELACRQCAEWMAQGLTSARIAVNVSAIQFQDPKFVTIVKDTLASTGLEPRRLELEITESLMMENLDGVAETLHELRNLGVSVSIDDFGVGYSSLAYLKKLPIQRLKIDRSFVSNLLNDPSDLAIAEAIVNMGTCLGLEVVAEGIESQPQADALVEKGCSQFQGFWIGRPLPADEFSDWFTTRAAVLADGAVRHQA